MLKIKDAEVLIKEATNNHQPCMFDKHHLKHITAVFITRNKCLCKVWLVFCDLGLNSN